LPPREAGEVARQICAGLSQAHRQGVIHGDLKPGNIIVVQSPESAIRVVITDFGMATMRPIGGAAVAGVQGGTPEFFDWIGGSLGAGDYRRSPECHAGLHLHRLGQLMVAGRQDVRKIGCHFSAVLFER
jgi:serine/threonine protein kinase